MESIGDFFALRPKAKEYTYKIGYLLSALYSHQWLSNDTDKNIWKYI